MGRRLDCLMCVDKSTIYPLDRSIQYHFPVRLPLPGSLVLSNFVELVEARIATGEQYHSQGPDFTAGAGEPPSIVRCHQPEWVGSIPSGKFFPTVSPTVYLPRQSP
jgi:hypothetical protein